ncbi:hypothetical protein LMH87_011403 [Akanthomyces muscarius]|uniref:Uncharacterized protein n=1 Tax=Akanthomyces muscarius TaxID=2231603 RepID=A0A9W8UIF0_AKAMU|nr:hypothetical protein LMH87_011403 [Akanthomyces muscarius]KAJ4150663.1 hypothetical protein LMH87_011403 [Akanthomyces muscarius]
MGLAQHTAELPTAKYGRSTLKAPATCPSPSLRPRLQRDLAIFTQTRDEARLSGVPCGWALVFRGARAALSTYATPPTQVNFQHQVSEGKRSLHILATTKISNPSIAALLDQDISRLDIAADYTCFIETGKRDGQLSRPLHFRTHWRVVGFLWEDSRRQWAVGTVNIGQQNIENELVFIYHDTVDAIKLQVVVVDPSCSNRRVAFKLSYSFVARRRRSELNKQWLQRLRNPLKGISFVYVAYNFFAESKNLEICRVFFRHGK